MTPDRIQAARAAAGLSQAQCARMLQVAERTWRRWETGAKPMPYAAWELLNIKIRKEHTPC